jgi:hypothetical protein
MKERNGQSVGYVLIQATIIGGKRNPDEKVTDSDTNENPQKKTFSRDTTKEGW